MFLLPFIIIAPLLSFLILIARRDKLTIQQATLLGLGGSFLSAVVLMVATISYFLYYEAGSVLSISLIDGIKIADFNPSISFAVDGLSLMLTAIVTWVGFLVQLFATWNMQEEREFAKVLAYLNMLLVSLLTLILADNLFLMYVGWEGAGMSGYLLYNHYIGRSHHKKLLAQFVDKSANKSVYANNKSQLKNTTKIDNSKTDTADDDLQDSNNDLLKIMGISRIADIAVLLAMLLLYREFDTLEIATIIQQAGQQFQVNDASLVFIVSLLLIGAITKSAQLPLHTWATSSSITHVPAPVLAMLHSIGLLVGAYLISRLHPLFILTPDILLWWVGVIGAVTTIYAALCAVAQTDIKRIVAFAGMTQMGFVFLAMGIGAWQLAVFQMMTFALTQALLFLSAGAVIASVAEDTTIKNANIFQIGGLVNNNPIVFYSFLMGVGSLNVIPFITLGYYSKLGILWETYVANSLGNQLLMIMALLGVLLTAFYSFRLVWFVFFNSSRVNVRQLTGLAYKIPLVLLAILGSGIGFLLSPNITGILTNTFPNSVGETLIMTGEIPERYMTIFVTLLTMLIGFTLGWLAYVKNKGVFAQRFQQSKIGETVYNCCYDGFGFSYLYDWLVSKPMLLIARLLNRSKLAKRLATYISPQANINPNQPSSLIGSEKTSKLITAKNISSFDGYLFGFVVGLVVVLILGLIS